MGLFGKKSDGGILDVIRCDESSYLIWKWHPTDVVEGQGKRENAIRWGSKLRIREGSAAIFVYQQRDGAIEEAIEGPYDGMLQTRNLPIISNIVGALYGGDSPFPAEIYFINLARVIQVKFGVPFFDIFDPRFPDFGVPVAVRGTISFQITDYKEFIKLHRLETFSLNDFQSQIKDATVKYVKDVVANAPTNNNVPVMQVERMIVPISDAIEADLGERLYRDFGVTVSGIDIAAIEIDKSSDDYRQLLAVTKDVTASATQAEAEVHIKNLRDMQRINAEDAEAKLRAKREEEQYAQHLQTQSANLAAHQINQQAAVGIAGAEGLGKMGSSAAAEISGGMNPASMMAGMAIGGAIGQNTAGIINGMMGGLNQQISSPPPIPVATYHVAVDGKSNGPFSMAELQEMIKSGKLTKLSLIWREGMAGWAAASSVNELQCLFENSVSPPPIPTQQ